MNEKFVGQFEDCENGIGRVSQRSTREPTQEFVLRLVWSTRDPWGFDDGSVVGLCFSLRPDAGTVKSSEVVSR